MLQTIDWLNEMATTSSPYEAGKRLTASRPPMEEGRR
jgi:hypothetical protein